VRARGFAPRLPWRSRLSSPSKDWAARLARFCERGFVSASGIDEPARLASRDKASPGSRLSPVRGFIGGRHLEDAGGAVRARGFAPREPWRPRLSLTLERRGGALSAIL